MKTTLYLFMAALILLYSEASAQCEAIALPYTENFETVTVPALPECTSSVESADLLNSWETGTITQNGLSNNILKFNMLSEAPALSSSIFNGRPVELEAAKNYSLTLDYGRSNPNVSVFYITIYLTNVATGSSNVVQYLPALDQNIPGSYASGFINVAQSGTYTLGIEIRANIFDGFFFIDNLVFKEWVCPVPENLTVTAVTSTSASFSWSGDTPGHYQYSVVPAGDEPVFSIGSGLTTATKGNLEPATDYVVFVRNRCINQDGQIYWSDWSEGVNFTTLGTLGVSAFTENNFQYYPNPVTTALNIGYDNIIDTVTIYSTTGQLLLTQKPETNHTTVNTSGLAAGMYYITVTSEGYMKQVKLMKE